MKTPSPGRGCPPCMQLLGLLLCGLLCSAPAGADSQSGKSGAVRPALTVTVTSARTAAWSTTLGAHGSIAAWQESLIGTELNGVRLTELKAQVGDQVRRGQLLARFAEDSLKAELDQQKAALDEAEANLAEAQSNARRALQLKESGAISIQQISQYATARNTAAARVAAAKASLQAAAIRLQQARVTAPDDGVISSRSATLGAVAQSGAELFRFIRQGRLEWRAEVTAEESTRLSPGMSVRVQAADGSTVQGKLRVVAPTLDPQTRKALVYVDLADRADTPAAMKNIRAGMFARGEFVLGDSDAWSVPAQAVVMRDGHASVFLLDAAGKVRQQRVTTGRSRDGRTEILSGLSANARVVERGAGFLADGDTVRVVTNVVDTVDKAAGKPAAR